MKRAGLILIGLILAGAAVLQVLPRSAPDVEARSKLGLLPASLPGWQVSDVSLGATEAAEANVAGVLQFDDVVFREYRSAKATFAVYAAYWRPGKIPTQLVASHTPDRCWSSAGWVCDDQAYSYELPTGRVGDRLPVISDQLSVSKAGLSSVAQRAKEEALAEEEGAERLRSGSPEVPRNLSPEPQHLRSSEPQGTTLGGGLETDHQSLITNHRSLKPAQWRKFTAPNGGTQYVLFWQLVGDELYDFGSRLNRVPHPLKWWRDAAKQIFRDPPEQYFIRLSSDRPFEELAGDAGFQSVLETLGKIGLDGGKS